MLRKLLTVCRSWFASTLPTEFLVIGLSRVSITKKFSSPYTASYDYEKDDALALCVLSLGLYVENKVLPNHVRQ